ncbi:MAG: hypothetical protein K2X50_08995 [Gammaproteobacteria bacterium]|nr:hypothetical protein [Gammaproteobacteria bacterium]
MREIKPTWRIAHTIARRHAMIAGSLMTIVILVGAAVISLILASRGEVVSLHNLYEIFIKYQPLFIRGLLMIYLLPVNLLSIILALQYKYKRFRVVIYATAQPERRGWMANIASRNGRLANDIVDQV